MAGVDGLAICPFHPASDPGNCLTVGRLCAQAGKGIDNLIAAIALSHNLTVVTRNVKDFQPSGVPVFDPFSH